LLKISNEVVGAGEFFRMSSNRQFITLRRNRHRLRAHQSDRNVEVEQRRHPTDQHSDDSSNRCAMLHFLLKMIELKTMGSYVVRL
jgi:hypothetical protein